MITQPLILSLLISSQLNATDETVLLAQGRASEVIKVERLVRRCGLKNWVGMSVVRGAEFYHHPDEPGAELALYAGDMNSETRDCVRKGMPKLITRLKTAHIESDAL